MNKLGIKVYSSDDHFIDGVYYAVNSIRYFKYQHYGRKVRYINYKFIGFNLYIIYKKR